jgi:hypothetical protein
MAKQKVQYTHESVRISAGHAAKVRSQIVKTRQSICGFIEIAIDEKLERENKPALEWPIKKETK